MSEIKMIPIHEIIITLYFWIVASCSTLVTLVVCAVCYPFVDQKTFARIYELFSGFIILNCMTLPGIWTFKIIDLRADKTFDRYIMISNHASFIDTLLTTQIPLKKKYIMAKVFSKIPVFGWLCLASGHVPVDKNDKSTTEPAVEKSVKAMSDGCSFLIYPEGRRSSDPLSLLPFKTGAFRLSQKTGVPILPIVIRGTGKGMRIGAICSFADMEIVIGDPIQVEQGWENIKPAIERSREFISKHLIEIN